MSPFFAMLTLENFVGLIFLVGVFVIVAVVVFLIAASGKSENNTPVKHKFGKLRRRYLFGISAAIIIISIISFRLLPYSRFQTEADEVVTVVGIQWDWQMAHGITNKTPHHFLGKNEITLPVNKSIKFIVTSDDVTHSFSIYNNKGVLLTQVQAMPQYKNELEYIFTKKGKYTILCLEYCGLVHPFMTGTIYVQ